MKITFRNADTCRQDIVIIDENGEQVKGIYSLGIMFTVDHRPHVRLDMIDGNTYLVPLDSNLTFEGSFGFER